ncbi:MAG: phosphoglycerate dehydrogenase [Actinobacteria bacterium]|nr:phosphoglycerate dehydrogenase [Actinomycetota bacterium]
MESKYKVLVAEKISPLGIDKLREHFDVEAYDKLSKEELLEKIGTFDALIVRSGVKVEPDIIEKADNLKIIGRAGIGIDNINLDAATKKGIIVANVPESNIISAAEHTFAMLMSAARNIPDADASMAGGEWNRSAYQGVELHGKTLGIIGLGRIGTLVAERAEAFGMNRIGYDPFISEQKAKQLGVETKNTVDEVLKEADFLTLHVPRSEETYHLIGREQMSMMKNTAIIINVSRGGVIDEEALAEAIENGVIAGAALDVFENEPPGDIPLVKMPKVVVTPHLGASTSEAQKKAGVLIAEQIIACFNEGFVSGAVNIAMPLKEVVETLKPFLPLCEKLGKLFNRLMQGGMGEIELEVFGEISEYDTSLLTVAFLKGFLENISTDTVTYVNAPMLAKERGILIKESKSRQSRDYVNLISVKAGSIEGEVTAAATLVGLNQEMFVNVLDYHVDIAPSKYLAFIIYEDRPGMIGKVGTIIGDSKINIGSLQVGHRQVEGCAAMGLTLDSAVPPELLSNIKTEVGIKDAVFIVL